MAVARAPVIGTVFNGFDATQAYGYKYRYTTGYTQKYGYGYVEANGADTRKRSK